MTIHLFILLSSLLFFYLQELKPRFFMPSKQISTRSHMMGLPTPQSSGDRIFIALVTGERKILKKSERDLFMRLGITHIFTPSGMHLSTLTVFFHRSALYRALSVLLSVVMGIISLFPAMARVLLLQSSSRSFACFCFLLLLEGIFFSWQAHPISWICSWLFLGICLFAPSSHKALWFSLGQMILSHVFFQVWSPIGIILNLLLLIFLKLVFPFALMASFLPQFPHSFLVMIFESLFECLRWIDQIHNYIPLFIPHLGHLAFMFLWLHLQERKRTLVLPIALLILSGPLNQMRPSNVSNSMWEGVSGDLMKCRNEWKNHRWEETCRPNKGTAKKLANFH